MKTALEILNQVEPNGELLDTDKAIEAMELYAEMKVKNLQQALVSGVICRAAFKGEITNEEYDAVIKYIKDMQMRDWVWTIAYTEGRGEKIYIDYVLEKHGI